MDILAAFAVATTLAISGRANANVSMASAGRTVAVVWSASTAQGAADIYAATSKDAGATFSVPVRVNSTEGDARVGGEQPPQVSILATPGKAPVIVVLWTAKGKSGTVLETARSTDGGRTYGRTTVVGGSEAAGNRGWESLVVDRNGGVDVVWLDHRELAAPMAGAEAAHHMDHGASTESKADGVARAQLSKLYFANLAGSSSARAIAAGVCYCCKTAMAVGADGSIYAAWRHVYPGNLRDIAFTVSRDRGLSFTAPVRVSDDHWAIDGCPENGPTIAIGRGNRVHVVWPTLVPASSRGAESLGLFYGSSADGRGFTPRQAIPVDGVPRHPRMVAAADGSIVLAWDETAGNNRLIAIARGTPGSDGTMRFQRVVTGDRLDGVYPAVAETSGGVVVAWTSGPSANSIVRVTRQATGIERGARRARGEDSEPR